MPAPLLGFQGMKLSGMYEVIIKDLPMQSAALKIPGYPSLEVIPATQSLANAEVELVPMVAREMRLKKSLNNYLLDAANKGERFDYVIIDCPPSLGLLTINALVAAQELLIPIQCEYYSLEGLTLLASHSFINSRTFESKYKTNNYFTYHV